ncbi:hypothetical protein L916_13936 [Phytophthora nicotianae]|uniref:Uncharacterized protein n=2 Tax=Phytophthora nicotianae TaxID=4792 RepID=W2IJK6_PHYNI|nr:hypothetical protein L916_13936 [Phytophthora nicotianae]
MDASICLNKYGLFSLTLGILTAGSSKNVGIKEDNKEYRENFRLVVCGLASGDFRTCFDEVKKKLRDADFPMDTMQMVFSLAIIGLPNSDELLLPIRERLKRALVDTAFEIDDSNRFKSRKYELMLFKNEDEYWRVFSSFSNELQRERVETYNTPQLRDQLQRELDQFVVKAKVKNTMRDEPDKEMSPPRPAKTACKTVKKAVPSREVFESGEVDKSSTKAYSTHLIS